MSLSSNGSDKGVLLGREIRVTITPTLYSKLTYLASLNQVGQTACAERLLTWAIEFHVHQAMGAAVVSQMTRMLT